MGAARRLAAKPEVLTSVAAHSSFGAVTVQWLPALIYAAIVVVAVLAPYAVAPEAGRHNRWVVTVIAGGALLLTAARGAAFPLISLVLILPLLRAGAPGLLGGFVALCFFAPVIWWTAQPWLPPFATALFVLLGIGAVYLPRFAPQETKRGTAGLWVAMSVAFVIGLAAGLPTGSFASREPFYFAWHHWGAYLAPVEAWRAGGLPYRDFPSQYGLGPTALLSAVCGSDCWRGIFWTTIVANAAYFSALAGCTWMLTARRPRGIRWLALAALACASFIWTAFPADLGSTAMTPSVAGLRFLPLALLLLHIVHAEESGRRQDWIGHAIWLANMFWSPESALFGTMVWWPYLALRKAEAATTAGEARMTLLLGAARGLAAFAAVAIAAGLLVWLISGEAARPADVFAYVLHPPGALPINLLGTVWLAIASILLAVHALTGRRSKDARTLYACLLGFVAAASYFLSRSHDNNVINLFPILVVLLAAIRNNGESGVAPSFNDGFVRTTLAAMVAFITAIQWFSWHQAAERGRLLDLGPSRLIAGFAPQTGSQPAIISADGVRGLEYLRTRDAGAVVLLDENKLIPRHDGGQAWTSVNNVANLEPLPRAVITRYICRGAVVYKRPGWILVDEPKYGAWAAMFLTAYEVSERADFGRYRAYRLIPRTGPRPCAEL